MNPDVCKHSSLSGPLADWQNERIQVDSSTLIWPGRNTRQIDRFTPKFSRNQGKEDMYKSSVLPVMGVINDNFMYIPGNIFFYCP